MLPVGARAAEVPRTAVASRALRVAATKSVNSVPIPGTRISMPVDRGEQVFLSGRVTAVNPTTRNVMQQLEIRCFEKRAARPAVGTGGRAQDAPDRYTSPTARNGRNNEGVDRAYAAGDGVLVLSAFALTSFEASPMEPYTLICELWIEVASSAWDGRGPYLTVLPYTGASSARRC